MGDIKRMRTKAPIDPFVKALGLYLIELARKTGTDRFHCTHVLPANPYYKPEHGTPTQMQWSTFSHGVAVAAMYPEQIVYDDGSGWFTVTLKG